MRSTANNARWHGRSVRVQAEVISRYLWTTCSIDAYIDDECLIRTGGVWRSRGTNRANFTRDSQAHVVELSWQSAPWGFDFPYKLDIDGEKILNAQVRPANWPLFILGLAIIIAFLAILLPTINFLIHSLINGIG